MRITNLELNDHISALQQLLVHFTSDICLHYHPLSQVTESLLLSIFHDNFQGDAISLFLQLPFHLVHGSYFIPNLPSMPTEPRAATTSPAWTMVCCLMPPKATMLVRPSSILPYSNRSVRVNLRNLLEPDFQC